jgi:Domain of unknown function (DUF4421)
LIKFHFFWIFLAPLYGCIAQYTEKVDSTRIISYADKFVVKINVDTQTDAYNLTNRQDGTKLTITPNNDYKLFVSLDYEFFGLSIGFAPTFFSANNDDDLKGESSFSDFKFRAALGQWIQGFQLGKIKGYYIENTGDYLPGWSDGVDPYLQIPSFTTEIYGMWTTYNFNPNFSFRNIFYQTEWQKISAGSFMPSLYYSYEKRFYSQLEQYVEEDTFPIRLAPAYFYTLVMHENWFVSGNLSPSIGVRFAKSSLTENDISLYEKYASFTYALEGGLQLGYASRRIIFGASLTFNINAYNEDSSNAIVNDKIYGVFYFGYRLNAPRFIDRTYKKYAEKLGI